MPNISFQLFSTREFPVDETLKLLQATGIKEVEGFGPYYDDPAATKAKLDAHGLSMPTGHFSLDMVENEPERTIQVAKTIGIEAVIVPYIMPDDRPKNVAEWKAFGERLAKISEPIRAAGLQFGYHNHDFEFFALEDGSLPIDHIVNASENTKIELDLCWVFVAKHDPATWIKKLGDRLISVHVKDLAPEGEATDESGWADVGHGVIEWPPIVAALKDAGVPRYVIEHDNPNNQERLITRSYASVSKF